MVELSPEAKKLLEQLRAVDAPTDDERARAHAAAQRMLQAQGLRTTSQLPASRPAHAPRPGSAPVAHSGGSKKLPKLTWGWGVGIAATLGILAALALRVPAPTTTTSSPPATAPSTAPLPPEDNNEPSTAPEPTAPPPEAAKEPKAQQRAASSLRAELQFLEAVDTEIRHGAFASALQRLDHHKGSAQFQEERSALRVLALCGRDDKDAARARDKFLRSSPSSVLAARVQAACPKADEP